MDCLNQEKVQIIGENKLRHTSPDGSTPFTDVDSSYLKANLSDLDLQLLDKHIADGKDFSNLTESQGVNLFL